MRTIDEVRGILLQQTCASSVLPYCNCFFVHDITIPVRHMVDMRHLCHLSDEDIHKVVWHNERKVVRLEIASPIWPKRRKQ
jgi:hypothetical protein